MQLDQKKVGFYEDDGTDFGEAILKSASLPDYSQSVWKRGVALCMLLWQVMFRRRGWGQRGRKCEGVKPITIASLKGPAFSPLFDLRWGSSCARMTSSSPAFFS